MESNLCDRNHSDSNLLLPPRKRLLAGFKKQNSDTDSDHLSTSSEKSVFDTRINDFMKFHLENPNLSLEEIVEESCRAAEEAVKVAVAARAMAEEKEEVAANAMSKAKKALESVANISDEVYGQDRHVKKNNKTKKHLPVKVFYNKPEKAENRETDKEMARYNMKANKHKRVARNGLSESESEEKNSEYLISEKEVRGVSGNRNSEIVNDYAEVGRKKGRMKQKKLPISICSFRDLANRNEEIRSNGGLSNKESIVTNNMAPNTWKCKSFKAPSCVKPNKVMEP